METLLYQREIQKQRHSYFSFMAQDVEVFLLYIRDILGIELESNISSRNPSDYQEDQVVQLKNSYSQE